MAILSLSCIFVVMTVMPVLDIVGCINYNRICGQAFGGLVVNLKALPDSFGWVKYLSAFYYAAEVRNLIRRQCLSAWSVCLSVFCLFVYTPACPTLS